MIEPVLVSFDDRQLELSSRHGEGSVSYALGAWCEAKLALLDYLGAPASAIRLHAYDSRMSAIRVIVNTGIFEGGPTIYWMKDYTLHSLTSIVVPDSLPLERVFDILRVSSHDPNLVWHEVERIADVRRAVGIFNW